MALDINTAGAAIGLDPNAELIDQFGPENAAAILKQKAIADAADDKRLNPLVMKGNETLFAPPPIPMREIPFSQTEAPKPITTPGANVVWSPYNDDGRMKPQEQIARETKFLEDSAEKLRNEQEMDRYLASGMHIPPSGYGMGGRYGRGLGYHGNMGTEPKIVKSGQNVMSYDPITGELTHLYDAPMAPEALQGIVLPDKVITLGKRSGNVNTVYEGQTKAPTGAAALIADAQKRRAAAAAAGSPAVVATTPLAPTQTRNVAPTAHNNKVQADYQAGKYGVVGSNAAKAKAAADLE